MPPPSPGHGGGRDDAPLGPNSAKALYYKAAADLEKHGPLEPFLPLSELGKRCGIEQPAQPTPTLDRMIEKMLGDKQWLNEQKQTMPPSMFKACTSGPRQGGASG